MTLELRLRLTTLLQGAFPGKCDPETILPTFDFEGHRDKSLVELIQHITSQLGLELDEGKAREMCLSERVFEHEQVLKHTDLNAVLLRCAWSDFLHSRPPMKKRTKEE